MIHLGQHFPSLACISVMDFYINVVLLSAYQCILQMDLDTFGLEILCRKTVF